MSNSKAMSNETIYHKGYFLSINSDGHFSILLGLPTALYPIGSFESVEDFCRMLRTDPSQQEWNTQYTYSYRYFTEINNEEKYGLRSMGNPTVILLTKAEWGELAALFEKAWPAIQRFETPVCVIGQ
jgi:hypothetical protein